MKAFKNSKPKTFWVSVVFFLALIIQFTISCDFGPPKNSRAAQAMRGKAIFNEQCMPCHGLKDTKPTVDTLSIPAPDLTRIMQRRGAGEFPIAEIARFIDGRLVVKAHGPRQMPVWGEVYSSEGMDEEEIRGRKGELVAYLMSIQEFSKNSY